MSVQDYFFPFMAVYTMAAYHGNATTISIVRSGSHFPLIAVVGVIVRRSFLVFADVSFQVKSRLFAPILHKLVDQNSLFIFLHSAYREGTGIRAWHYKNKKTNCLPCSVLFSKSILAESDTGSDRVVQGGFRESRSARRSAL